jgi:hypothetical protein
MISKHLKLMASICLLPLLVAGQTGPPSAAGATPSVSAPIHILYRLFFRDVAALDAAAAKSDAAGLAGGNEARGWFQTSLFLTPAQASALKQSARDCNQALDQHQQKAQPVIDAVRAQAASSASTGSVPPQLAALEQERTAISNTCMQNLHTALGDRKFTDIDVFVRTRFAERVSAIAPPGAPFANAPITRLGAGGGK